MWPGNPPRTRTAPPRGPRVESSARGAHTRTAPPGRPASRFPNTGLRARRSDRSNSAFDRGMSQVCACHRPFPLSPLGFGFLAATGLAPLAPDNARERLQLGDPPCPGAAAGIQRWGAVSAARHEPRSWSPTLRDPWRRSGPFREQNLESAKAMCSGGELPPRLPRKLEDPAATRLRRLPAGSFHGRLFKRISTLRSVNLHSRPRRHSQQPIGLGCGDPSA